MRILNANPYHFITISLLFVPFTFLSSSAVQFYFSSSSSDVTTEFDPFNVILIKTIISSFHLLTLGTLVYILACTFFIIITTVWGVALITHSTNQVMQHKQLTFISTFEALNHSYIPLFSTFVVGLIKLILISLLFTLSPLAITQVVKALGFHFGLSIFSLCINMVVSYALILIILFLITIWGSAASIAVLELKSGFEPLQQSAKQSTEFRRHSFFIVYITAFSIGPALANTIGSTTKWVLFLQVFAIYLQSSLMILHYVVANTVLYMQCKTMVEGDVSSEYVSVIMNEDDGDAVHVVTDQEEASGGFNYMMYLLLIVWVILL